MTKFKIKLSEKKVKIVVGERTFTFATTTDGVTVGPDFTGTNRHATILPGGKTPGKWGDWGIHISEPTDSGENSSISDSVYWNTEIETEAYLLTRRLGTQRPMTELTDETIALLNFNRVFTWARHWGLVSEEGDAEVIQLSKIVNGLIDASEKERRLFADDVTFEVDIDEAYEHGALFGFNRTTGKLMLLHADGRVNEMAVESLLKGNRERLKKHEPFREWVEFLDYLFEGEDK